MDHEILPLYITEDEKPDHTNILIISDNEKSHCVFIKNTSALFNDNYTHSHKKYYCFKCMHGFDKEETLSKHKEDGCNAESKVILPTADEAFIQFKNYRNMLKVPFIIYADFECILEKITSAKPDEENSYTEKYQHHKPSGCAYKLVSVVPEYTKDIKVFNGPDCISDLLQALKTEFKTVMKIIDNPKQMIITNNQEKEFLAAKNCHICNFELGEDRVRDHCHLTGLYRGPAHNNCNINFNYKNFQLPIVFHNLKGYDSHLIIQGLKHEFKKSHVSQIIQKNIYRSV